MGKIKLPSKFIESADWHLRSTVPSCLDMTQNEWMIAQESALNQIINMAISNKVNIFVVGDIFHSYETTSFQTIQLVQNAAKRLNEYGLSMYVLFGNHDLKYHTSENIIKSPLGILINSVNIYLISTFENVSAANFDEEDINCEYVFKHTLTIPKNEIPFEEMVCETPESLLRKFDEAKFVIVGDYHKNFVYKSDDNRFVINSGCLTKQASDFEDYQCGVYFVDTDNDNVVWCPINIDYKFNHNGQIKKEIDENIEKFATGIKKESITLDFITSLRNELPNHEQPVQDKVNEWIGQIGQ